MKKLFFIIVFACCVSIGAQTLKGKVYDDESTVKGLSIINLTQKIETKTDDKGNFSIKASLNDSLMFYSLFHHPKTIIVTKKHHNEPNIFELKKIVNKLDEVLLSERLKDKQFEEEAYNINLKAIIEEDKKKNPHLYNAAPKYGLDFIQIIGYAVKLFKKKKKAAYVFRSISYNEFKALFETQSLFNDQLLEHSLKISKDHKFLFFEFCEAQHIDVHLLHKNKKLELLDELVLCSERFLLLIDTVKKED